uniref:BHLH domain-containing protein n=1 Tax=Astyanax mexicanus TaxID=7994 RepID=A0A3B1IQY7_ASTMX
MEKRRRARINRSLVQLKALILHALHADVSRHSKLEKAEILEMTVTHLRSVQRAQAAGELKHKIGASISVTNLQNKRRSNINRIHNLYCCSNSPVTHLYIFLTCALFRISYTNSISFLRFTCFSTCVLPVCVIISVFYLFLRFFTYIFTCSLPLLFQPVFVLQLCFTRFLSCLFSHLCSQLSVFYCLFVPVLIYFVCFYCILPVCCFLPVLSVSAHSVPLRAAASVGQVQCRVQRLHDRGHSLYVHL